MENDLKITMEKIKSQLNKIFLSNPKMKLLVAYLIANLGYLTIGSYIFTTSKITTKFHYKEFSLGLRNILVLNIIVFLVICLEKRYKKNWLHLWIVLIAIFRWNFYMVCI
jgi:hypothetical protein